MAPITVLLADDNLIVREGVRALLARDPDVDVVGVAGDYDELIQQSLSLTPQVLVTDIRMPPNFQSEGIEGAKEVRKRLPGTGVVVLSQYDSPEYAVDLLLRHAEAGGGQSLLGGVGIEPGDDGDRVAGHRVRRRPRPGLPAEVGAQRAEPHTGRVRTVGTGGRVGDVGQPRRRGVGVIQVDQRAGRDQVRRHADEPQRGVLRRLLPVDDRDAGAGLAGHGLAGVARVPAPELLRRRARRHRVAGQDLHGLRGDLRADHGNGRGAQHLDVLLAGRLARVGDRLHRRGRVELAAVGHRGVGAGDLEGAGADVAEDEFTRALEGDDRGRDVHVAVAAGLVEALQTQPFRHVDDR